MRTLAPLTAVLSTALAVASVPSRASAAPVDASGDEAEPEKAEPDKAEPEKAEPEKAEPDKAEPEKTEPEKAEPEKAEPDETEPDETEPDTSEPASDSEPDKAEPDETEPDTSEPDESEPDTSEPDESEPEKSEPDETEPEPVKAPKADPGTIAVDTAPRYRTEVTRGERITFGVVGGVLTLGAIGLAATAGWAGAQSRDTKDKLDELLDGDPAEFSRDGESDLDDRLAQRTALIDDGQRYNRLAIGLGIPASILLGTGAAMIFLAARKQKRTQVAPTFGRRMTGLVLRARF